MNICALIPLFAIVVCMPVLIATASRRSWRRQDMLFTLFLVATILWSLVDLLWHSDFCGNTT